MLGTHNSGTGEPSANLISKLLVPFARCQSKTILEQFNLGCRVFDIRVRADTNKWYLCHGVWKSKSDAIEVLDNLNKICSDTGEIARVLVTYEGSLKESEQPKFLEYISYVFLTKSNLELLSVNVKKPKWKCLKSYSNLPIAHGFRALDFSSWHTLIPIPWLWDKIEGNHEDISGMKLVDFYG